MPFSTISKVIPELATMADLQRHLDDIPAERIRLWPSPGTATVRDVIDLDDHHDCLCELIDGILVEKAMGFEESWIASNLLVVIGQFLHKNSLGIVTGADGLIRLLPDQVRIPDVAFFSWERLPDKTIPRDPVPQLVPDLAIEIISTSNTQAEMQRKLREYFAAGSRSVWYIDPQTRSATVYASVDEFVELNEDGILHGGEMLPGLEVALRDILPTRK